jgi:transcriptional regulator with XRE-family HTH domain
MKPNRLGKTLRALRSKRRWSLDRAAVRSGVPVAVLGYLEGSPEQPSPAHLRALARVYEVDYLELLIAAGILRPGDLERPTRRAA